MPAVTAAIMRRASSGSGLVLDVAHQLARIDFGAVDVPSRVGGDALGGAAGPRPAPLLHRLGIWNERRDLAVLGAADAQTALEAGVLGVVGLGIGDIDGVVLVDEDAARPTELLPFREEFSVLVEDLDTAVGAVADEQPSARIHGERVRHVEFARPGTLLAPGLDELAVLVELDDAGVGVATMSIGDED